MLLSSYERYVPYPSAEWYVLDEAGWKTEEVFDTVARMTKKEVSKNWKHAEGFFRPGLNYFKENKA